MDATVLQARRIFSRDLRSLLDTNTEGITVVAVVCSKSMYNPIFQEGWKDTVEVIHIIGFVYYYILDGQFTVLDLYERG